MDFLKHLLHTFIPHEGNEYKPHFFRVRSVLAIGLSIVLLSVGAFALQNIIVKAHSYLAAVISSALVDLTNIDRTSNQLTSLKTNPVLERAAQLKANDMAAKGYFAHYSPEGVSPWHWFKEAGYSFTYAGENLAVYFSDSADVERAWMNSPTHRANILNSNFTEIGIATAKGTYQGVETVFVVQMFGTPSVPRAPIATLTGGTGTPEPVTPPQVATTTTVVLETEPVPAVPTPVAGATVEELGAEIIVEDDAFIAVKRDVATQTPLASVVAFDTSASLVQRAMTSPRTMMNMIFAALAIIIAVALALMIGIEIKRQHPWNVFLGVLLLVLMAAVLYFWQTVVPGATLVT